MSFYQFNTYSNSIIVGDNQVHVGWWRRGWRWCQRHCRRQTETAQADVNLEQQQQPAG